MAVVTDWKARAEAAERKLGTAQAQMQEAQMKQLAAERKLGRRKEAFKRAWKRADDAERRVQELEERLAKKHRHWVAAEDECEKLREALQEAADWLGGIQPVRSRQQAYDRARAALDQHGLSEGARSTERAESLSPSVPYPLAESRRITMHEEGDPREWWGLPRSLSLDPKHKWRLSFDDENLDDEYKMPPRYSEVEDARRAAPDSWTRLWLLLDGWDSMLVAEWPPWHGEERE